MYLMKSTTELYTKMVKTVNFMSCVFYHNKKNRKKKRLVVTV